VDQRPAVVHGGLTAALPHELARARASGGSGGSNLTGDEGKHRWRPGDPTSRRTWGGESTTEANGGGEQNTAVATGVHSTRGGYGGTCGENQRGEMRPGHGGPFISGGTMS
jgi:hypothetical protein